MIAPTHKIVNQCLDSTILKDILDIPKVVRNKKKAHKSLQIRPIFITDADHDLYWKNYAHRTYLV